MKNLSAFLAAAAVASSLLVQPAGAATAAPSNPLVVPGAGTSKGQEVESLFVRDFFCQLLPC